MKGKRVLTGKLMAMLAVLAVLMGCFGTVRASAATGVGSSLNLDGLSEKLREKAAGVMGITDTDAEYREQYENTSWKDNFTKAELREMACIIFAEANGMGFEAKVAVANVVLNRMYDQEKYDYANTVHDVIYDNKWGVYQFSPVFDGSLKRAMKIYDSMDPSVCKKWEIDAMTLCIEAAKAAMRGCKTVPDDFFYFNSHLQKQSTTCINNGWAFMILDRHIYYKNVPESE